MQRQGSVFYRPIDDSEDFYGTFVPEIKSKGETK